MQRDINSNKDSLKKGHCVPCEGGVNPLTEIEENNYHDATPLWNIQKDGMHKLIREYKFNNFKEAVAFINTIADIAESEGHHPNLCLHDYKSVSVELFTHAIGGLSTNDFILAVKIDDIE